VTGNVDIGNALSGIFDDCSDEVTIGGTTAAARNVISGNNQNGLVLEKHAVVQGNYIGTNAVGTADLGNSQDGIFVADSSSNTTIDGVSLL